MIRFIMVIVLVLTIPCIASVTRPALADQNMRPIYVISDLHMGVGKAGKEWNGLEDFRWPRALDGFLRQINNDYPNGVILVIAGDFLELWQHPDVACTKLRDTECGCSLEEMKGIVSKVIAAHKSEFESLSNFLSNTQNRVIIIPGNHDAALMNDKIWELVKKEIPVTGRERFEREAETWFSVDGYIAIEHGHQLKFEANRFPKWPDVVNNCNGETRFFRTAGENFVQTLYNDKEADIPLIDNLIPETKGLSVYGKSRDWKGKFKDFAKLVTFMTLQTSWSQKVASLKVDPTEDKVQAKSVLDFCRQCVGEDVILTSMGGKSYRTLGGVTGDEREAEFRSALREQIASLDDDAMLDLCLRAAADNNNTLERNRYMEKDPTKCAPTLGAGVKTIVDREGTHVRKARMKELNKIKPGMVIYVYGHTHEAKLSEDVTFQYIGKTIKAFNTGAFQRLMSTDYFDGKRRTGEDDVKLIGRLKHDDMEPCYPALEIKYGAQGEPEGKLKQWRQAESDDKGDLLDGCTPGCSARPANCQRQANQ